MDPMKTPARVLGLVLATVVMFVAGSGAAFADAPTGSAWPEAADRGRLDNIVLFGGATVGLFILVVLFGLLTARRNYVPPSPSTELETTSGSTPAHH
jgi:putative flippase GtrA